MESYSNSDCNALRHAPCVPKFKRNFAKRFAKRFAKDLAKYQRIAWPDLRHFLVTFLVYVHVNNHVEDTDGVDNSLCSGR